MKSAREAQAEALELNPKPMSAHFPLYEWKKKEGNRSYRLPDSLCNGAVMPFAIVVLVVHRLLAVTTSVGEIEYRDGLNEVSRDPD